MSLKKPKELFIQVYMSICVEYKPTAYRTMRRISTSKWQIFSCLIHTMVQAGNHRVSCEKFMRKQ